jgi:hypothetical protein
VIGKIYLRFPALHQATAGLHSTAARLEVVADVAADGLNEFQV